MLVGSTRRLSKPGGYDYDGLPWSRLVDDASKEAFRQKLVDLLAGNGGREEGSARTSILSNCVVQIHFNQERRGGGVWG